MPFWPDRFHLETVRSGAAAAPFVGALDAFVALLTGVWSMVRLLVSGYTGPLVRLRRVSDSAVMDFYPLADGRVDVAAILTFKGASLLVVVYVYDQFGSNNRVQSSAAVQPLWVQSVSQFNGAPALDLLFSYGMTCDLNVTRPYTILITECNNGIGAGLRTIDSDVGNQFISSSRAAPASIYNGGVIADPSSTPLDPVCEILTAPASGFFTFYKNGVDATTNNVATADWGKTQLGTSGLQGETGLSYVAEIVTFNTALDSTQVTAMQAIFNPATL